MCVSTFSYPFSLRLFSLTSLNLLFSSVHVTVFTVFYVWGLFIRNIVGDCSEWWEQRSPQLSRHSLSPFVLTHPFCQTTHGWMPLYRAYMHVTACTMDTFQVNNLHTFVCSIWTKIPVHYSLLHLSISTVTIHGIPHYSCCLCYRD